MGILKDLTFNILAKDKTGAAFSAVKRNLAGVEGAARTTSERIGSAGKSMQRFGAGATAVSAGLALAFRDVLGLYDTQARAEAKVAQAIRTTGGAAGFTAKELGGLASGLQGVTRFGDEDILANVTGQLLTFTNVAGDEFKRAQAIALDLSTVLETDLKSSAIQVGKALNDPVKGLSALTRSGIQFSASQTDVIKKLAETGQVAEAQQLILEELEKQYGGQAQSAATAGLGALDQLSNAWGDVKEEIGGILSGLLPPVVDALKTLVAGFQSLPEPVKRFSVVAGLIAVAVGPVIGVLGLLVTGVAALSAPILIGVAAFAAITAAVAAFWPEIKAAVEWVGTAIGEMTLLEKAFLPVSLAVRAVRDTFVALFPETAAAVGAAVESVVGWIDSAVGQMTLLERAFLPVSLAARAVRDLFVAIFPEASAAVGAMVSEVVGLLKGKLADAFDFVKGAVSGVKDSFFDLYDAVVGNSYVPDMIDGIAEHFGRLDGVMVGVADGATGKVGAAFEGLASGVSDSISDMVRTGTVRFSGFKDTILQIGDDLVSSLLGDVFARLNQGAGDALNRAINPTIGPLEPSAGIGGALSGILGGAFSGFLGSFATGADFMVGGAGGLDRNRVSMNLTRGERVQVTPAGQSAAGSPIYVTIQTPDVESFRASRGQVAAQLARAAGRGQRNL